MSAIRERLFTLVPQDRADDAQFSDAVTMLVNQFDYELNLKDFWDRIKSGQTRVELATVNGELAGAGSYTIYNRDEALSHEMLDVRYKDGKVSALRLSTFAEILDARPDIGYNGEPLVVETDYMVVDRK